MKFSGLIAALIMTSAIPAQAANTWAIVVHGGAGVIERKDLSPEHPSWVGWAINHRPRLHSFDAKHQLRCWRRRHVFV